MRALLALALIAIAAILILTRNDAGEPSAPPLLDMNGNAPPAPSEYESDLDFPDNQEIGRNPKVNESHCSQTKNNTTNDDGFATLLYRVQTNSILFPCQPISESEFKFHERDLLEALAKYEGFLDKVATPIPKSDRLLLSLTPESSRAQFIGAVDIQSDSEKVVWASKRLVREPEYPELLQIPRADRYPMNRYGLGFGRVHHSGQGEFMAWESRSEGYDAWLYVARASDGSYRLWFDEAEVPVALTYCKIETDAIELELRWFALRKFSYVDKPEVTDDESYVGEPVFHDDGSISYPEGKYSPDIFTLSKESFQSLLNSLACNFTHERRLIPRDDRLLLHWNSETTVATFTHAAVRFRDVGTEGSMAEITTLWPPSDPRSQLPRNTNPPKAKYWMIESKSKFYGVDNTLGRSEEDQYGIGVGGIYHDDRGFFAPSGTPDHGPGDSIAWLCIGVDEKGNYWLWWEAA